MSKTFNVKKVWHSSLKYKSPLVVKFGTGQVVKSQYDDASIIYFTVRGDEEGDYYYQIESDAIAEQLRGVERDQWYELKADGMKDEATLSLNPMGEGDLPAIETVQVTSSQSVQQKTFTPKVESGTFSTGSIEGDMAQCLAAAHRVYERGFGAPDSVEAAGIIERLAVSMFIQANMNNFRTPIIADAVEATVAKDADPEVVGVSAGDMSALHELVDGLPLKSGTSHDGKQLKRALDKVLETTKASNEEYKLMYDWVLAEAEFQVPDVNPDDELPF